jgi:hypothetical protein
MTVPHAIRDACGIETGTELLCRQTGEGVFECRVQPPAVDLRAYLLEHTFPSSGPTDDEIDQAVAEGIFASNEGHN